MHVRDRLLCDRRPGSPRRRRRPPARVSGGPVVGARLSLLELREVEVEYRRAGRSPVRAVAGATLSVDAGQVVGLVGETGCGKSSLARAAVGLLAPTAGSVWFEGRQ